MEYAMNEILTNACGSSKLLQYATQVSVNAYHFLNIINFAGLTDRHRRCASISA
jgi:hypothetical protein